MRDLDPAKLAELYAKLHGADLRGAIFCKWTVSFYKGRITVGCETKTAPEWLEWLDSEEEFETPRSHEDFPYIRADILAAVARMYGKSE